MHAISPRLRLIAASGLLLLSTAPPAAAQIDTANVPQPPAAELAALERFFGKYEHSGSYYVGTGPWQGTLEIGPAIKGWYVELIIQTRHGPIDRELRTLTTWDAELRRYRAWSFQTLPQSPPRTVEGEGRIDGDEFITEWKEVRGPDGGRGTLRNRMRMEGPNVLVIRTEVQPEGGGLVTLGVWRFRRFGTPPAGVDALPSRPQTSRAIALTNSTVIDVRDGARQRDRTVVVEGGRIATVGRSGEVAIPSGALVVDAGGRYLIPGLWDMHVHSAAAANRELPVYLALGVTGVRNMHTTVDTALELTQAIKRRIADGTLTGPRFMANGAVVDGPKPIHRGSVALGTSEAARGAVDSLQTAGADFIKVYNRLPRDVYFAVAEQAKRRGIPFVGHLPMAVRAVEAADAGQRSFEHVDALNFECSPRGDSMRSAYLTDPPSSFEEHVRRQAALAETWTLERCGSVIEALRRNHTWVTPTLAIAWAEARPDSALSDTAALSVLQPVRVQRWRADAQEAPEWRRVADAAILAAGMKLVRALHHAGVPLLAGTDVGNPFLVPGYSLHKELELFVEIGLTPLEALQTATINAARFLEATDSLGTVEPGKLADLVLLDADPLDDIRHTRRIRAVIANGRYYDREALSSLLEGVAMNR